MNGSDTSHHAELYYYIYIFFLFEFEFEFKHKSLKFAYFSSTTHGRLKSERFWNDYQT